MKYAWLFLAGLMMTACVTKKKYQELENSKKELEQKLNKKIGDCETQSAEYLGRVSELDGNIAALDRRIGFLHDSLSNCRVKLAENQDYIRGLGDRLDEQKKRLAAELDTKNKILQTKELELAGALNKKPDVTVNVEGHTDNKPMNGEKIKDNWDLSVLRATSIVRILSEEGKMSASRITASGRGETNPISDNGTAEGRAKNRRTEIILTPKLDKIFEILNNN
ncbi:MAG: hypothetical protein EBV15_04990 [Bacteroidetes bacterium]|nr:hypothetical protein [Bacteroidota bacterium]